MVISCILTLFLLEQLSRLYLVSVETFVNYSTNSRNLLYRRGWVEYTENKGINTDHLIIIITGSQSWAPEIVNEDDIYPSILERKLNDAHSDTYTVLNWGVPGIDLPEYNILMTRLADYDPDLVFFIVDWKDMTDRLAEPLNKYGTDVVRLAYFPQYRQYLTQDFLNKHDANDPLQAIQNSGFSGMFHTYLLVDQPRFWGHDLISDQISEKTYAIQYSTTESIRELNNWSDDVDWYLDNIMTTYLSTVGETPLVTVSSPQFLNWYGKNTQNNILSLYSRLEARWGGQPHVDVVDGTNWIPIDRFYTGSHFDEIAHELMADELLSLVTGYLE